MAANATYTLTLGDGDSSPLPSGEGQGEGSPLGSGSDVSYVVHWGDGSPSTTVTADDLAAEYDQVTHVFTADSLDGITVDVTVAGATHLNAGSLAVSVDLTYAATTALAVSDSSPSFGSTVTLTATVAAAILATGTPTGTVEFYDGTMDLGSGTLDTETPPVATLTTPPLADGEHDFTATYSGDGTFDPSTSAVSAATVADNPTGSVVISGDASPTEGNYTLGLPTTAGDLAVTAWSINWGDGTPYAVLSGASLASSVVHDFGAPGAFTITAVAINSADAAYRASLSVNVAHAGPSGLSLTVDAAAYSGADTMDGGSVAGVELHGTFTGPGSWESYTVSIAWGDGSQPASFSLDPGQTTFDYPLQQYARPGAYTITVTVADADGLSGSSTAQTVAVDYTNSQPSGLALSLDNSKITAGDQVNLSGSFVDPQANFTHSVTINWGDGGGSADTTTMYLDAGETTFQADPHTFASPAAIPFP